MRSAPVTSSWRRRSSVQAPRLALPASAALGVLIVAASAEWLDFRGLRAPILLAVGVCVLATAYSLSPRRRAVSEFLRTSLLGAATWGAGGALYAIIHAARGESFEAGRFGPQWSQALGLIGVHALFLGLPTGIAIAAILHILRWRRQQSHRALAEARPESP